MINLETLKADLINTKDSKSFVNYSLSINESIEIVNRAITAEDRVIELEQEIEQLNETIEQQREMLYRHGHKYY